MTRQPPLPTVRAGVGPPLVLLHGFAIAPATYDRTVRLLAQHAHVLTPMWMYVEGEWSHDAVLEALVATVEAAGIDEPFTLVGHSAGGALALGLAARLPDRLHALVLVDSMGASDAVRMRRNAIPGRHLARLASLAATRDFFGTIFTRPRDVGRAAWWAYRHDPSLEIATVSALPVRRVVLWAATDALLPVEDGRRFAERLSADFHVVQAPEGPGVIDHDWPYRRPRLFVDALADVGIIHDDLPPSRSSSGPSTDAAATPA